MSYNNYEGVCAAALIAAGTRRLAGAMDRSKSSVFEQQVIEHKVFQCCMHKMNGDREEHIMRLHAEAMQRHAHPTKAFITAEGWKSIQNNFSREDMHLVGLSYLQMIYHHNVRRKAGADGGNDQEKAILEDLVLYTRWDDKLDNFILGHYLNFMKMPLQNGKKKKCLTVQDWEEMQRRFEFWHNCCPPMRQLQGRVNELLRGNRRLV